MACKFPTTSRRRRTANTKTLTKTHEENDDNDDGDVVSDDVDKTAGPGKRLATTAPQRRRRLMTVKKGLFCARAAIQSTDPFLSFKLSLSSQTSRSWGGVVWCGGWRRDVLLLCLFDTVDTITLMMMSCCSFFRIVFPLFLLVVGGGLQFWREIANFVGR